LDILNGSWFKEAGYIRIIHFINAHAHYKKVHPGCLNVDFMNC
jgi:hypothetical protein